MHRSILALLGWAAAMFLIAASPLAPAVRVVVYPLAATGNTINREASSQIATSIATQLAIGGEIAPIPPVPGIERSEYLKDARRLSADYYVTGFMSPLGDGVSIVEQVVSTQTGIVVFSNSAQIKTMADAAGQGDVLRSAIVRHSQRNLGAYDAPPPPRAASPSPAPSSGAEANLGKLFGRKKEAQTAVAPAPVAGASPVPVTVAATRVSPPIATSRPATPAPRPIAVAPVIAAVPAAKTTGGTIGILVLGGPASDDRKAAATQALITSFERSGRRAIALGEAAPSAALCASAATDELVGGTLDASASAATLGQTTATASLRFIAYTCAGKPTFNRVLDRDAGGSQGSTIAIDRVATAAVGAYLHPPKR